MLTRCFASVLVWEPAAGFKYQFCDLSLDLHREGGQDGLASVRNRRMAAPQQVQTRRSPRFSQTRVVHQPKDMHCFLSASVLKVSYMSNVVLRRRGLILVRVVGADSVFAKCTTKQSRHVTSLCRNESKLPGGHLSAGTSAVQIYVQNRVRSRCVKRRRLAAAPTQVLQQRGSEQCRPAPRHMCRWHSGGGLRSCKASPDLLPTSR